MTHQHIVPHLTLPLALALPLPCSSLPLPLCLLPSSPSHSYTAPLSPAVVPSSPQHLLLPHNHLSQETQLKVLVQPNDVQVKRVGRASCIEPDVKLCVELDTQFPKTIAVNAYLKVVGQDNKDKLILLRRSEDITFTKTHKREVIAMKLRFLKTIKVQVLKRNLGVTRPEASIVFEAVSRDNDFEAACATQHFAIISDPRYLDEVKYRRRALEKTEPLSDDEYQHSSRRVKRRRIEHHPQVKLLTEAEEPTSPSLHGLTLPPLIEDAPYKDYHSPAPPHSPTDDYSPLMTPPSTPSPVSVVPSQPDALQALKECADYELITDSKEEELTLMKLVAALKHKGCNFDILPPRSSRVA